MGPPRVSGSDEKIGKLVSKIDQVKKQRTELKAKVQAAESRAENLISTYNEQVNKLEFELAGEKERNVKLEAKNKSLKRYNFKLREKMEKKIKERDERYTELERSQKRAKQKIQELQKEKEDVEAQLSIASEKASQAMAQQSAVQEELECTRRQTGEALRSLDGEKQQLRSANSRQKEILEELHRTLEAREHHVEELKQSLSEKDQEDLADRESKLAELEAASTGEAVRLGVALESAKGEVIHAKQEHQKEKEIWEAALQTVKAKLEESEKACLQYEIDAAKTRSELESELAGLQQVLKGTKEELLSSRAEISRLEDDFKDYKNRAHALLREKNAELSALRDMDLVAAQEAALKDAERERDLAFAQNESTQLAIDDIIEKIRCLSRIDAERRIEDMAKELESTKASLRSQEETWRRESHRTLSKVNEEWNLKYIALEARTSKTEEDLNSFRMNYEKLKMEHDLLQEITNKIIEAKENKISRLLDDNNNLQISLRANHVVQKDHSNNQASAQQDSSVSVVSVAEQQILAMHWH